MLGTATQTRLPSEAGSDATPSPLTLLDAALRRAEDGWPALASLLLNRAERPLQGRIALLGAGSVAAVPLVEAAVAQTEVVALVDNAAAGDLRCGRQVIDAETFLASCSGPDVTAVICPFGARAVQYFTALAETAGCAVVSGIEAARWLGVTGRGAPSEWSLFFDFDLALSVVRRLRAAYLGADGGLDEASRATLNALALHRLSGDDRWCLAAQQGKQPGYFDAGGLPLPPQAVIVDGGAHVGGTVAEILAHPAGARAIIHAFEPDAQSRAALRTRAVEWPGVTVHAEGLWSEAAVLAFDGGGMMGSNFSAHGKAQVPVVALDEMDLGRTTTIKLDVEGAELAALAGARRTIETHQAALAVCAYHRPRHLVDILDWISATVPSHRVWVRHQSGTLFDTVVYAAPQS